MFSIPRKTYRNPARRISGASVAPCVAIAEVMAWTVYSRSSRRAATIARQSSANRLTFSVMLSSTRKIARAPWSRASRMSARTRSKAYVWKLRPRISMMEQKLQSNVQPRDVSTTSICRPISV